MELHHSLEQAAFQAWPALHEETHGPWLLRFADGYTKRANSANAMERVSVVSTLDIEAVEAFYRLRGQPPIFRLASFCTKPEVDNALADRGYRFVDLSLVMTRELSGDLGGQLPSFLPDAASWLAMFHQITDSPTSGQDTHLKMLSAIPGETAFAAALAQSVPVACGLGVVTHAALGLFDVATRADARRQGLAKQLCAGLLHWGRGRGASTAYLQVVGANHAAIRLYESLGFRRAYHYWYRVGPPPSRPQAK